ncbi:MAG TPA: hypothetical protein VEX66_18015 [Microlunatus sp.]|nr:hypothetical protein [Microlunatus sp.]
MATATTTPAIDDRPTIGSTAAPSIAQTDTTEPSATAPRSFQRRLRFLGGVGRAILEASSIPSHPYLTHAVGPNGAMLWMITTDLWTAESTTPDR